MFAGGVRTAALVGEASGELALVLQSPAEPLVQARQIWLRDCTGADLLGKAAEGVAGSMISNRLLHVSARLPWHAGEGDQQSFPRGHPGAGVSRHSRLIMVRCSPAVSKLGELEYCRPCSTTRA